MTIVTRRNLIRSGSTVGVAALAGAADSLLPGGSQPANAAPFAGRVAIRPEDFGAVADGQFDCTAAFKAAVAVLANAPMVAGNSRRLPLLLNPGVYRLTETITIPGMNVIMTGVGRQNSVLLIDHATGPGLVFSGGGDIEMRGIMMVGSPTRKSGPSGDGLVFLPYAGQKLSFRISVIDVTVTGQPGNGFVFSSPEGLRMENVNAGQNRGHGCLIDAGSFQDLCASIEFARFSNNGGSGLKVVNMMNSRFSRVECLNNVGPAQMWIDGTNHRIELPDCEYFEAVAPVQSIGLLLSGRGHIVEGGMFYKVNTAIMLQNCSDTRIRLPRFEGDRSFAMAAGVQLGHDCYRNVTDLMGGNLVKALVVDLGAGNVNLRNGRDPAVVPLQHAALSMPLRGQIVPNLVEGRVLSLVTDGAVHVLAPAGGRPGDLFTLIVDMQPRGIGTVNFADAYRGAPAVVAANPAAAI